MKIAERKIWDMILELKHEGRWIEPLLQVHDAIDLEFEADERFAREINERMTEIMTYAPDGFSVPIATSGDYGLNLCAWDDKAPFDPSVTGNGDMRAF
jgi:DNA polymerase I-like protein with 3'-5' exonuclease and polymerase domains